MSSSENEKSQPIRVLLIEDNPADADLLAESLEDQHCPTIEIAWSERLTDGLHRLATECFDLLLLDLSLPDSQPDTDWLDSLRKARKVSPELPIIILTGLSDRLLGLEAVKEGAQDYLVKGRPNGESIHRAIRYAIERKRVERILQETAASTLESQARLKLALDSSQIGTWTWKMKEDLFEWDDQIIRLWGCPDPPKSFGSLLERIHKKDREKVILGWRDAVSSQKEYQQEFRVICPDSSVHWLMLAGKIFTDTTGSAIKMTGICQDVTKSKEQEQANQRLALLEQRQEFIAMLAHDLKNPVIGTQRVLTHIINGLFGEISIEIKELLGKTLNSNHSMLLLVNNIMDCYRLDADGESFDCVQLDLNDLLTKCLTEMKPLAEEAQISMTLAISGSGKALADKFAMHRVLCNLIGNAIKFTPKGGRIDVAAYERDAKAIIAVKDTGCGMTSADQESVFRRFFQAKRSYRSKGLGLGLYICQKLLEGQKGSIKCESVLGEGTTFEIALPLCEKEDEQPSVLVVDDSQLARTFAENVLRSLSIQTDSVSDGSAALLAAQKKNYNAILLDLMMPEMDGYATSKALRSLGVKTPILACSGSQVSEAESLTQAGCDAFILKPVTRENFKSVYSKFTASAL